MAATVMPEGYPMEVFSRYSVTALQCYSVTMDEIEMTCLGIVCLLF